MSLDALELTLCLSGEVNGTCAVDALRHGLRLLFDRSLYRIGELQGLRRTLFDGIDDQTSQFLCSCAPFTEGGIDGKAHAYTMAVLTYQGDFFLGVGGEAVEGNDDRLPEGLEVLDMTIKIGQALAHALYIRSLQLLLIDTSVHLQPTEGSDEDGESRLETSGTALDVVELLRAEIRSEARLRDGVFRVCQSHPCSEDGVTAVGNISEGTAVDEGRCMLGRLH